MSIWPQSAVYLLAFGFLFAFGYAYNLAVDYANARGYTEGYTWLLVVIGVLVVELVRSFLPYSPNPWFNFLISLAAFASAGFWMAAGDWWRYVRRRQAAVDRAEREVDDVA